MGRPGLFHIDVVIPFNQDKTQSHYHCIYIVRQCNKVVLHQFANMQRSVANTKAHVACRRQSTLFLVPIAGLLDMYKI